MAIHTDTAFKEGFRAARLGRKRWPCPYAHGSVRKIDWLAGWDDGAKLGRGRQNDDPACVQPTDCGAARRSKRCRDCHIRKLHADPEFAAKRNAIIVAARSKLMATPGANEAALAKARSRQIWTPEKRVKLAERLRELNADPAFHAKKLAGIERFFSNPANRDAKSDLLSKLANDPAHQKKIAEARLANGTFMKPSKKKRIAAAVRDTNDTYLQIAAHFDTTASTVSSIAGEYNVRRGRGYHRKLAKKMAETGGIEPPTS